MASLRNSADIIYVRWQAAELSVGRLGERARVREPPHVVLNPRGQIYALGLEAEAAAAQSGYPLLRLTSFRDVQDHPAAAASFVRYLALLVWSENATFWSALARVFRPRRPRLIIHFLSGTDEGLSAEAAALFVEEFGSGGIQDVFLWIGEELGVYALRGAPVRGEWIGRAPTES